MKNNCPTYVDTAWKRLDRLTKPPRSLGRLEEIAAQLCGIQQRNQPKTKPRSVLVFAGDHGVCKEGVSAYPQSVTGEMLMNMALGGAAVNVLSRLHDATLRVVDVGSALPDVQSVSGVERRRVRAGTRNIAATAAMTKEEMEEALAVGRDVVRTEAERSTQLIVLGEMGIGNTTSASALCAALLPCPVSEITGRGTGLDDIGLEHKISIIQKAIALHKEGMKNTYSILACLGGLEIAAMVGAMLAAHDSDIPVLLDGFIGSVAALLASMINPDVSRIFIAAHTSVEPGHRRILEHLELKPILDLGMCLGEASGALVALPVIDAAAAIFNEMATFESAGVSSKTPE